MESAIRSVIKQVAGKKEVDLDELFKLASTLNLQTYCSVLQALHHTCWEHFSKISIEGVNVTCNSMITFILCSFASKPNADDRKLKNFPNVKIHPWWKHEGEERIRCMTMQEITDLLFGLEWSIFSDLFMHVDRELFINEAYELFLLVENRIKFMIQWDSLSHKILDVDHFVTRTVKRHREAPESVSYESDEEAARESHESEKVVQVKKHTVSTINTVNDLFIFQMDTIITFIGKQFHQYHTSKSPPVFGKKISLQKFRTWLFVQKAEEDKLLLSRRLWQESLEMTPSYERVFKRNEGFDAAIFPRKVFLSKSDKLASIGLVKSLLNLTTPFKDKDFQIMTRLATDSVFRFISDQTGREVSSLLEHNIIQWNRIRATWVVNFQDIQFSAPSMTHAFRILRLSMMEKGYPNTWNKIDLSVYDSCF